MTRHAICTLPGRLENRLAIVTGANSGIGLETVAELARRGANVIMACRNRGRAQAARKKILDAPGACTPHFRDENIKQFLTPIKSDQLIIEELDMASFASIRAFAERVAKADFKINFLINNAGVMACPYSETVDGNEMQIGTNYLGHFLLTELLMPSLLRAGPGSRVICVSSVAHHKGKINTQDLNLRGKDYSRTKAYCQSKLANVIHARQLAQRHKEDGLIAVSVHPGVVKTDLWKRDLAILRNFISLFMKSPWEGAQTTLYAVLANDLENGGYYADCARAATKPLVQDDQLGNRLWDVSLQAVGVVAAAKEG